MGHAVGERTGALVPTVDGDAEQNEQGRRERTHVGLVHRDGGGEHLHVALGLLDASARLGVGVEGIASAATTPKTATTTMRSMSVSPTPVPRTTLLFRQRSIMLPPHRPWRRTVVALSEQLPDLMEPANYLRQTTRV